MTSDKVLFLVPLEKEDVEVLRESLWHSLQRADIPDKDRDRMYQLREDLIKLDVS